MKKNNFCWVFVLIMVSSNCWAYGSSSSSKACAKPKFTDFLPAENAEVTSGSSYSFIASANTHPNSIKVLVKGLPADINVKVKSAGYYEVSGVIPESLKDTYARISIDADAESNCNGSGGWLVKVR
jgi:hypothetical protein